MNNTTTNQAAKELAELVTRTYINSADTTSDLIYFTVDAYHAAADLIDHYNANHIETAGLPEVKEQINILLFEALQKRYA